MLAGLLWIAIYLLPLDKHAALRSGQSVIYFVLLTLWGLDYMREERRLTAVIKVANDKGLPPNSVEFNDVQQHKNLFSVTSLRPGFRGMILPLIFILGLIAGSVLIVMQYVRVAAAFYAM